MPEVEAGSRGSTTPASPPVPSFGLIGTILPSRPARTPSRRAQRLSRMARLRATASAARSVLDRREHDGMLDRVGTPIPHVRQTNHQTTGTEDHQKALARLGAPVRRRRSPRRYPQSPNRLLLKA